MSLISIIRPTFLFLFLPISPIITENAVLFLPVSPIITENAVFQAFSQVELSDGICCGYDNSRCDNFYLYAKIYRERYDKRGGQRLTRKVLHMHIFKHDEHGR